LRELFHNLESLKQRRRSLRANLTPAEALLWKHLQQGQLENRKFRRQHSAGPYILDFYCPAERIAIELDGTAHDHEQAQANDRRRDEFLANAGIRVLRFENEQVVKNVEGVLWEIRRHFRDSV
jgi:very-short-patch-repair endonuclease